MKIFISAAEASSDAHGAQLLKALRERVPDDVQVEAFGIGGPKLREAGLRVVADARELLSMGFVEVLGKLPRILSVLRRVSRTLEAERPDVAVLIDYPDFHFRLARRLFSQGVPAVYYIPPKLWAWRKGRLTLLRRYFQRVLCIFPFEEAFYRKEGLQVKYVGNPLVDELPMSMSSEQAREKLGLSSNDTVLAMLPGSRPSEVSQHLQIMLEAAEVACKKLREKGALADSKPLHVLMPFPETADIGAVGKTVDHEALRKAGLELRVSQGDSALCFLAAQAAIVKSGTSTLEAALLGCPLAVIYKTSRLTAWLYRRFVRYKGPVGLVNLIIETNGERDGSKVAREILLEDVTVENLADEAFRLLSDVTLRARMKSDFGRIRETLLGQSRDEGPSLRAAREVLEVAGCQTR